MGVDENDYEEKNMGVGQIVDQNSDKQVRIQESTVACDWAGAVMPENHEKK